MRARDHWLLLSLEILSLLVALGIATDAAPPTCQPQGLLKLSKPYPRPAPLRFEPPVCVREAPCTCCGLKHLAAVQQLASSLESDPSVSPACKLYTAALLCRACDARIGVGAAAGLCPTACDTWFAACAGDYFEIVDTGGPWGRLRPCTERPNPSSITGGGGSSEGSSGGLAEPLVCALMSEFASSGAELCAFAGLSASSQPIGRASGGGSSSSSGSSSRDSADAGGDAGGDGEFWLEAAADDAAAGWCFDPFQEKPGEYAEPCRGATPIDPPSGASARASGSSNNKRKRGGSGAGAGGGMLALGGGVVPMLVFAAAVALLLAVARRGWQQRSGGGAAARVRQALMAQQQQQQQQSVGRQAAQLRNNAAIGGFR